MDTTNACSLFELTHRHAANCQQPRCCVRDNRIVRFFDEPQPQLVVQNFVMTNRPPEEGPPAPRHHGVVVSVCQGVSRNAYVYNSYYIQTYAESFDHAISAACQCDRPGLHFCLLDAACAEYNKS